MIWPYMSEKTKKTSSDWQFLVWILHRQRYESGHNAKFGMTGKPFWQIRFSSKILTSANLEIWMMLYRVVDVVKSITRPLPTEI